MLRAMTVLGTDGKRGFLKSESSKKEKDLKGGWIVDDYEMTGLTWRGVYFYLKSE
jgi:hypothetical protein